MSNYQIQVKEEFLNDVNRILKSIHQYQNQFKILKAYSLYKKLYRTFGIKQIIPDMVYLASIANKQYLLKNKKLKFKLISNLIEFGLKNDDHIETKNKLISMKLNLFRSFFYYSDFEKYYKNIDKNIKKSPYIVYEFLHYLLENEQFDLAENVFNELKINNKDRILKDKYFLGLSHFILNIKDCVEISKRKLKLDKFISIKKLKIKHTTNFSYVIVVTGNYPIFKKEIIPLIISLNSKCRSFLISITIHNVDLVQEQKILSHLDQLNIENYEIQFENINQKSFYQLDMVSFYTTRRFIKARDLLQKYNIPVFTVDADTIILKDIKFFIKENSEADMSLSIKNLNRNRNFKNFISAGYALFLPTKISLLFLNFYAQVLEYTISNKGLIWFIDQILLYSTLIFIKRKSQIKVNNNINNYYKNKDSYFYHTLHNKLKFNF